MNILLQIASDSTSYRQILYDANQGAQILGTILILVYVFYTYRTFREIKKQNDYQQDAYLNISTLMLKDIQPGTFIQQQPSGAFNIVNSGVNAKYIDRNLHLKMKEILKKFFTLDDALFEGNYFTVKLTNYGKTEIKVVKLTLTVTIKHSKELAESKMLKESVTEIIKTNIEEIISRDGGEITIPVISTASFPIYEIKIDGQYEDVRGKTYQILSMTKRGENKHFHRVN